MILIIEIIRRGEISIFIYVEKYNFEQIFQLFETIAIAIDNNR